nr:uncharacterized protein LOC112020302 [Quercus suber]POF15602.1 protein flp [Quercus suber]
MDWLGSSEFSARVEGLMTKWHVPGIAIATTHDRAVASKGFGYMDVNSERHCTPDTLFDIASSSKSLTAASVALLVEDEAHPAIQWNAKMSQLLPGHFVISQDSYTDDITLEDILSHRSGVSRADESYLKSDDARSVTRNLRNLEVAAPIRNTYIYCNMMYTVATYLIEKTSDRSFAEFLHEHFFRPLRMASTHLGPDASKSAGLADRIATGHYWSDVTNSFIRLPAQEQPEGQGAGSIITSANDYLKWVQALMHQDSPITEKIQRALMKPRIFEDPDLGEKPRDPFTSWLAYGLGLESYYYRGIKVVKHDGLYDGFASTHFFLPDQNFGGVILTNAESGSELVYILQAELIDAFLQVPHAERPDWDALATASAAEDDDPETAASLRRQLYPAFDGSPQPHTVPLQQYVGTYRHAGYHTLDVVIKDGQLHIDAPERSMAFWIDFEHICDQTKFVAHLFHARTHKEEELSAEFRFEDTQIRSMGIKFEDELEDMIWFDRV